MSDLKISQLNSLAGGSLASNDVFAIVDTSASETKKITSVELVQYGYGLISSGTLDGDVIEIGTTSVRGTLQLTDATNSTSTTTAATPNSVKTAYDLANAALPASGGSVSGNLVVGGNLTVNGTTTTIDTTTLVVEDKNIEIGSVDTPSDTTADGGGITLKGATDKTLTWVDSTDCWTFNQSLNLPAGTASLPGLIFNGDVNSGLYQSADNEISITTNGTQRVVVNSSGNVGIGSAPGNEQLRVQQSAVSSAPTRSSALYLENNGNCEIQFVGNSSNDCQLRFGTSSNSFKGALEYELDNNNLKIYTNGAEKARITSIGNVGIGVSSPGAKLHLEDSSTNNATIRLQGASATSTASQPIGTLEFYSNDTSGDGPIVVSQIQGVTGSGSSASGGAIDFYTREGQVSSALTHRMRIDRQGNVGIGTNAPNSKLEVDGFIQSSSGLKFNDTDSNYGLFPLGSQTLGFNINGDEKVRISANGNLGIGTSSPLNELHVSSSGSTYINVEGGTTSTAGVLFGDSGDQDIGQILYSNSDNSMRFVTNTTERFRVDSSGRLLVGTSSSVSTGSSTAGLQLHSTTSTNGAQLSVARFNNDATGGRIVIAKSRNTTISSGTIIQNNDALGTIQFAGDDGTDMVSRGAEILAKVDGTPGTNDMPGRLEFRTTADGANTPTERMRISNSGSTTLFSTSGRFQSRISNGAGTTDKFYSGAHSASSVTSSSTETFRVWSNGNVENTNNSYTAISDIKLKENIVDASSQWDDIKALRPVNYNFKEGQTHTQLGLIAQEVELVSPGLVSESPDRDEEGNDLGTVTKSVNYSVLYMKAVKALQEAMDRIETLEAKVAALEAAT